MAEEQNELKLIGKITVIQGDPGDGKTTVVLAIAAALTAGVVVRTGLKETPTDICTDRNIGTWKGRNMERIAAR